MKCLQCKRNIVDNIITVPVGVFCSYSCVIKKAKSIARLKKQKENREFRLKKFSIKSYQQKLNIIQKDFNKLRVEEELQYFKSINKTPVCISCQKPIGNDVWACGHFFSRKDRPDLRFNKNNTFLQHNKRCNKELGGDLLRFEEGIKIRFGEENALIIFKELEEIKNIRYTDTELLDMAKQWRRQYRELKTKGR